MEHYEYRHAYARFNNRAVSSVRKQLFMKWSTVSADCLAVTVSEVVNEFNVEVGLVY